MWSTPAGRQEHGGPVEGKLVLLYPGLALCLPRFHVDDFVPTDRLPGVLFDPVDIYPAIDHLTLDGRVACDVCCELEQGFIARGEYDVVLDVFCEEDTFVYEAVPEWRDPFVD